MRFVRAILPVVSFAALVASGQAFAGTCPNSLDSTYWCDGQSGGTRTDYCTQSGSTITCTMGQHGHTNVDPALAAISPTSTSIQVWGEAGDGQPFCCEFTVSDACAGPYNTFVVNGTTQADFINFHDPVNGDLECTDATVNGSGSGDVIRGSDSDYNNDILNGDSEHDDIDGLGGSDTIDGGPGDDILSGGDGSDTIYGGDGIDEISGGNDDDFLYGEDGTDEICGRGGNDELYGGPDADFLYAGVGTSEYIDGGVSDYDECGHYSNTTIVECSTTTETACPF